MIGNAIEQAIERRLKGDANATKNASTTKYR